MGSCDCGGLRKGLCFGRGGGGGVWGGVGGGAMGGGWGEMRGRWGKGLRRLKG